MKRVYIGGKRYRRSEISPEQQQLEQLLQNEKRLTSEWYLRMSGQVPWAPGERDRYSQDFETLSSSIRVLQQA